MAVAHGHRHVGVTQVLLDCHQGHSGLLERTAEAPQAEGEAGDE